MTKQAGDMLDEAYTDALLYGVGIIRIMNTLDGPKISHVPREEFIELADTLKFVVENTMDFTDQEPKS